MTYQRYFVAYAYFGPGGRWGFGNLQVDRSLPIAGQADMDELTARVTESLRLATGIPSFNVAIIGWQRFEEDVPRKQTTTSGTDNVVCLRQP